MSHSLTVASRLALKTKDAPVTLNSKPVLLLGFSPVGAPAAGDEDDDVESPPFNGGGKNLTLLMV